MPLDLNSKLQTRLKEILVEILPQAIILTGSILNRTKFYDHVVRLDRALPSTGKLFQQLDETIGPDACSSFVPDALAAELKQLNYDPDAPERPLNELIPDIDGLADRILESFGSLPWSYSLTFKLPDDLSKFLAQFVETQPLGPNARLIKIVDSNPLAPPKNALGNLASIFVQNAAGESLSIGEVVLQVDATGYIRWSFGSPTADQSLTTLRSIIGLGLAMGLFKAGSLFESYDKRTALVHRLTHGDPEYVTSYGLSHAEGRAIGSLALGNAVTIREDVADQIGFAKQCLNDLNLILDNPEPSRTIALAGKWFSDGTFGDDSLLNYVQITMVLEILLGDKATSDQVGLGTLLANRAAYLIGRSHTERQAIIDDFDKIYKVRSQIVHRGKHRLAASEQESFYKLRWLAGRAIVEEMKLLFVDLRR